MSENPGWCIPTWRDATTRDRCIECLTLCMDLLERRIPFMTGRANRIREACAILGKALDLDKERMFALSLAARFHDLGMLGVADSLLMKKELTSEELGKIREHTELGARLVHKSFPDFPDAIEGIWYHHERPDGKGPHGLKGGEIPLIASIVAVVEAVDAMAHDRPHRKALPIPEIMATLERLRGEQFNASVVDAFKRVANEIVSVVSPEPAEIETAPDEQVSVAPQRLEPVTELPGVTAADIKAAISKGLELRPLAPVVSQVMALANNPRSSVTELSEALAQDQALSVRVLKLANSSSYASGRYVSDVRDAINRIGCTQVRNTVIALGLVDHFEATTHIDARLFWEHSIACASFATKLAEMCTFRELDVFLLGVIHDVGRLAILERFPEPYGKVIEVAKAREVTLELAERDVLSLTHADAGEQILRQWRFPREIVDVIANHHKAMSLVNRLSTASATATIILQLADRLAHALILGDSGNRALHPFHEHLERLGVSPESLNPMADQVINEVESLRVALLVRTTSQEWPDLRDEYRRSLSKHLNPLVVSEASVGPLELFCNRFCSSEKVPNMGIMHIRHEQELGHRIHALAEAERQADTGPLPTLVVYERGELNLDHAMLKGKARYALKLPCRVESFLSACMKTIE